MKFEEAKAKLKEEYLKAGLELVEEKQDNIRFKINNVNVMLIKEDILAYSEVADKMKEYSRESGQGYIIHPSYYEQAISPTRAFVDFLRYSPVGDRTEDSYLTFGDPNGKNPYVQIGESSTLFFNLQRFDPSCLEEVLRLKRIKEPELYPDIRELYWSPATVKVFNLNEKDIKSAHAKSTKIIYSCLFYVAYTTNFSLILLENWRSLRHKPIFRLDKPQAKAISDFPKAFTNSDLTRFYQLAVDSMVPSQQFLSFYQILEYFFIKVSNQHLYKRLEARLKNPEFRPIPDDLQRIIQDVSDHRAAHNETEMLKKVIQEYVDENDIIEFIKKYEESLGENIYSKRRNRFGAQIEVQLSAGHVYGNIAKILRQLRNAIVHVSDSQELVESHIPFSSGEEIIADDVPLIRFLAEKVIIATSSSLDYN